MKPYNDKLEENYIIREFSGDLKQDDLVWHRDRYRRRVDVLEGRGWKAQVDNKLPFNIIPGDHFYIEANEFHRLIKANTNLKLRITEYYK